MERLLDLEEKMKFVPTEMRDELVNEIVNEALETIKWYSNPQQIFMELFEERIIREEDSKALDRVLNYLHDGSWFCTKPMRLHNLTGLYEFFKGYPHKTNDDIEFMLIQYQSAIHSSLVNNVNLRKPFWIFVDGNDEPWILQDGEFQKWLIDALKEQGDFDGELFNRTYIDLIKVIEG